MIIYVCLDTLIQRQRQYLLLDKIYSDRRTIYNLGETLLLPSVIDFVHRHHIRGESYDL